MDSASNGGPPRGCDVPMTTPNGRTAGAAARLQHLDALGDDPAAPDVIGRRKKRGQQRSGGKKRGEGLRHFSMKVREKVESKGRTSFNEESLASKLQAVADELVAEFTNPDSMLVKSDQQQQQEEKNIRRRVYDALNVLMALEIIAKEKREIHWKGLPSTSVNDIEKLKAERLRVRSRIEKKATYLQELEEQIICFQKLVTRNESMYDGTGHLPEGLALPFTLVQTGPQAIVEVEMSDDMHLVHMDFNSTPFELHDEAYVLKAMCGFCEHAGSPEGLRRQPREERICSTCSEETSPVPNLFVSQMKMRRQQTMTVMHELGE